MPTEFDKVAYEIGLGQSLFSPEQGEMAVNKLRELEGRGQIFSLPVVLERLQVISETNRLALENAARYRLHRDADKEIARIIQQNNYANTETVEQALTEQKQHYRDRGETLRIGYLLTSQGILTEAQRIAAEKLYELGVARNNPFPSGDGYTRAPQIPMGDPFNNPGPFPP